MMLLMTFLFAAVCLSCLPPLQFVELSVTVRKWHLAFCLNGPAIKGGDMKALQTGPTFPFFLLSLPPSSNGFSSPAQPPLFSKLRIFKKRGRGSPSSPSPHKRICASQEKKRRRRRESHHICRQFFFTAKNFFCVCFQNSRKA